MKNTLALYQAGIAIDNHWLVKNLSLTLLPGQLTTIIGPNGAGKTTLLRLLAGLWQATEGSVTLNGRELYQFPRRSLAQNITFVPQNTQINFAITVKDIVMMGRNPHLRRFQPEREYDHHCVEQALKKTDVAHLANRLVTELSGGERQRVTIARSLATEANIILLDEPTASLDIAHSLEILDLCQAFAQEGKTVAFSIHDINHAMRYAHQVALVHKGSLFDLGLPEKILTDRTMREVFGVDVERVTVSGKPIVFFFRRNRI
ncbi:MAG: ABC transporter ATP-binding protein [Gammaproteobacteria bacterium]|nr:MAG: ABC transporter ATP-binding protein [Gammaproteobacteria bacterium]RKZ43217.1 MAG: ABC transporter ATP-binding protein [Gammaproteobacteria bacterium]RKZ75199.1 MAG: ABC transporter ATP-binding protein [Gammaproteobacteria bacterium]